MDFKSNIKIIEGRIGYVFRDKSLLKQAFTRTSYCNEKNYGGKECFSSNEVLEFFGDSVLSTAIVTLLLRKNTKRYEHGISTELTEGDFSNIRSKLSDKRNLSKSLAALGLQKYMLLGEGDEKMGINEEPSVMEDLFESIVGAIYIDSDMNIETVIGAVSNMLDVTAYAEGEPSMQSYKNALQEWCADKKNRLPSPVYKTVSETGPDHKKTYERGVYIGDKLWGVGKGKNQKLADAAAAEAALIALKEAKEREKREQTVRGTVGAAKELRDLASQRKLSSPEYHDLGEAPESTETQRVYLVECVFNGASAIAKGYSKQEARDLASAEMIAHLGKEKKQSGSAKAPRKVANKKTSEKGSSNKKTDVKASIKKAPSREGKAPIKAEDSDKKLLVKMPPLQKAVDEKPRVKGAGTKRQESKKPHVAKMPKGAANSGAKNPSPKRKPLHHTKRS